MAKRDRSINWEKEEKALLREIIRPFMHIIENKDISTNTNKAKINAWTEITEQFNRANKRIRDKKQLVNQWKVTKLNSKKELSLYRQRTTQTGGGPKPPSPSPETLEILELLPQEFEIDTSEFDCDGAKIRKPHRIQSSMDAQSTVRSPGGEHSSLDNNYTQENSSTVEADEVASTSYAVPKTKDKKLKRKSEDDLMQLAANRLRQKPDEYENWALSCAADLKKMEPTQQIFAKSAIAAIIMEGQLGLLHRNSVKINTPTVTITPSPTYTRSTPAPTNYSSTPSPRYFINYSQQQNSELPSEELPYYQQNMYYSQQDNQQNMDNFQQENDANDISLYIKFNK